MICNEQLLRGVQPTTFDMRALVGDRIILLYFGTQVFRSPSGAYPFEYFRVVINPYNELDDLSRCEYFAALGHAIVENLCLFPA
jgi:hypothetical protein